MTKPLSTIVTGFSTSSCIVCQNNVLFSKAKYRRSRPGLSRRLVLIDRHYEVGDDPMEHADLIAELPLIEKLTALERIQLAKQRRALQLMRWQERERRFQLDSSYSASTSSASSLASLKARRPKIQFSHGTILLEATQRRDIQEVKQLLIDGADPNSHNEDGLTALHQCAIDNDEEMMQLLIDFHADVNARDSELWTPLHAAACCGHINTMQLLIKNGAALLAVNSDGNMPYDICDDEAALDYIETEMANRGITQDDIDEERLCNERNMLDDMRALYNRGGNMDQKDKQGATLLHVACANGYYSVAEFLLECGAWVHARDNDGWQPIHAASIWAQPDLIELLVQFGADINARTNSGETPLVFFLLKFVLLEKCSVSIDLCEDETTRGVILTLQVEVHRRRLLTFARDSRRMSKRKKPCSKFESPAVTVNVATPESRFSSTRSAVRRMSIRDRCGVTLARVEARREAAVLRSWSFGESDTTIAQETAATAKGEGEEKAAESALVQQIVDENAVKCSPTKQKQDGAGTSAKLSHDNNSADGGNEPKEINEAGSSKSAVQSNAANAGSGGGESEKIQKEAAKVSSSVRRRNVKQKFVDERRRSDQGSTKGSSPAKSVSTSVGSENLVPMKLSSTKSTKPSKLSRLRCCAIS
ncbi:Protein phosphatase 1 regulatory subunit 16A [Trichinella patagoniensis]|uniref:Protein phosphatase 1 regulatory subunit 16A n=1 Tax=Trichinella patagoniensis TaxID=990121 RepID=A0A0V1A312_9BILA|nr:Protein phosphatase 1 regulatory subunit 16A [Trichinella patagoniensis]